MVDPIEARFPGLRASPFRATSPATRDYNCAAWAAGTAGRAWPGQNGDGEEQGDVQPKAGS